jgi:prevent-host-death family protein
MTIVGISEARIRLSDLLDRAARGEEIVITRRGVQVARLMPLTVRDPAGQAQALVVRIRKARQAHVLHCDAAIREMIEEGRR